MATSNEAQDVVLCKYCQQNAAYYCKNCEDEMCTTCQVSHKGDHIFSNHVIVSYYEQETAGNRCRYHPTQFYNQGCQKCGIPICPECKIQSHFKHKDTDITTVCKKARKKIQNGLTDMQNKERDVENYFTKGVGYSRSQSFKQVKKILQDRATEMKSCIDNFLSKSLEEVEQRENDYQRSVENYISELSNTLKERRKACENNLEKIKLIDLPFYLTKNPDWNYVYQPHDIQGLQIVRFESKAFNKSEIERLFGTMSFEDTTVEKIFGNTQTEQHKSPELNNVSQPHDIQGLQNIRVEANPSDNSEVESLFGTLSWRKTKVKQRSENTKTKRPKTAAAKLGVLELPLRANSPTRHREVSKTERHCHARPISSSFVSSENSNRKEIGILEFPVLLKEFKSSVNFLFQIANDEQSSCVFISGDKSEIFAYKNVFGAQNVDPKYEILNVWDEPQGLAIGFNNNLYYSDSQYGVVEIGRHVINANRNEIGNDIRKYYRVFFNKTGYTFRGIHWTSSRKCLICAIPCDQKHKNASIMKISNDGIVENEIIYDYEGKPLFSEPLFVCENRINQNICVSDKFKVVVLTSFGDFCFNYRGVLSAANRAPFNPRGIACDGIGNILVADVGNDVVHLLKSNGAFVTYVLSSISPISQPYGICIDSENMYVWVVERYNNNGDVKLYAKVKVFQIYK